MAFFVIVWVTNVVHLSAFFILVKFDDILIFMISGQPGLVQSFNFSTPWH